jgi:hypothetical protein
MIDDARNVGAMRTRSSSSSASRKVAAPELVRDPVLPEIALAEFGWVFGDRVTTSKS